MLIAGCLLLVADCWGWLLGAGLVLGLGGWGQLGGVVRSNALGSGDAFCETWMRGTFLVAMLAALACGRGSIRTGAARGMTLGAPLIIAHRGASGLLPEHTLEAYDLAIAQGADFIEPDVVSTKDGVLIARHENEIGATTDAGERFPGRKRAVLVDGTLIDGWFAEDFSLAELKRLRARERLAGRSHANDGKFGVPTLDEVLSLVRQRERELGRTIGVYPETKHPTYFRSIGLPLEDRLLDVLGRHGFGGGADAVFIQSFETGNLRALHRRTSIRLIQLVDATSLPPDLVTAGDKRTLAEFLSPASLHDIASYAFGLGPAKALVQPLDSAGGLMSPTTLVRDAHAVGLAVHVWTLRSDAAFLPHAYNQNAGAEWLRFAALGVDGMFGDFPGDGRSALRGR